MREKNAFLLWMLSIAVFGVITTEMGIIGLLPELVKQLHITPSQVGLLVSIYAVIVAVTGPFLTLLLSKYDKKKVLLTILFVFIISNIMYALTTEYNLMLLFRVIPALFQAVFYAVALVVATNSVPKEKSAGAAAKIFAGVAVGLVFGVPLSTLIAEHFSLSYAFLFAAAACFIAFLGILLLVPSMPSTTKMSYGRQLNVLRSSHVWLAIVTVTLIFAAMFSSFSYIAEYFSNITHLNNNSISGLLTLFGVCGLAGNFIFSGMLQKDQVRTSSSYPLCFAIIFVLVWIAGETSLAMCLLTMFWGAFHSSGLIVSQTWLMREANKAPEFANSLYMSFSNLGITLGSLAGGWFISKFGTRSVVLSSVIFSMLAFLSIIIKQRLSATCDDYCGGNCQSDSALSQN